jgi:hypothetical protein
MTTFSSLRRACIHNPLQKQGQIIPFSNCSCREDEPKTVLEARRGEVDKGTGNLEMEQEKDGRYSCLPTVSRSK